MEQITLAGGCFWCLEAVFLQIPGVSKVVSGYTGGIIAHPTYEQVCSGTTGHAEVVQIAFDPTVVSLEKILEVFWKAHDPTTLNRQGNDVGTQYRSGVYYSSEEHKRIVEGSLKEAQKEWPQKIVTEVEPLKEFWPAEGYHQNYYQQNPNQGYCRVIISPKLKKLGLKTL